MTSAVRHCRKQNIGKLGICVAVLMVVVITLAALMLPAATQNLNVYSAADSTGKVDAKITVPDGWYINQYTKLKVSITNASDHADRVKNYLGTDGAEVVSYKVALVNTQNNGSQEYEGLWFGGGYKLELNIPEGMFTGASSADYFYCIYESNGQTAEANVTGMEKDASGNITKVIIEGEGYPQRNQFIFVRSTEKKTVSAGGYVLKYNKQKDAFRLDPAYKKYHNEDSPIGIAGSFHVVAFDEARLGTHTNGNVLTRNLYTTANFGTKNLGDELSYVQNYHSVNENSASASHHTLVVGSSANIGTTDGGSNWTINGSKVSCPKILIQDDDTASAPFIDIARVETEVRSVSERLATFENGNISTSTANGNYEIKLTQKNGIGVIDLPASSVNGKDCKMTGFSKGYMGTIIVNVDCSNVSNLSINRARVYVDGADIGLGEITDFSNSKVIWNFVNADGTTLVLREMAGLILAPGATVDVQANVNGTIIGDVVLINAESHRADFTGKLEDVPADEIVVKFTKPGNVSDFYENVELDVYEWQDDKWVKVDDVKTDENGNVTLEGITPSHSYTIVEDGTMPDEDDIIYWQPSGSEEQPTSKPPGTLMFNSVKPGTITQVQEELDVTGGGSGENPGTPQEPEIPVVDLTINKVWQLEDGTAIGTLPEGIESVQVMIWKHVGDSKYQYDEVTITRENNWQAVISGLPVRGEDGEYTYSVQEINVDERFVSSAKEPVPVSVTDSGFTAVITNTYIDNESYELPDTGGAGTAPFVLGGAGMVLLAAGLLYRRRFAE